MIVAGRVIQASFLAGRAPAPTAPRPAATLAPIGRSPGPPKAAFAGRAPVVQPHGGGGSFQVDPGRIGLASGGGRPLPDAVRSRMEAALGGDFSAVRVHVGPQAERIGAVAFATGSDIYFAPGRYQPDTPQGRRLLGHELAHVVQQRAGRVRHPTGAGLSVVQDRALEAEADRLGARAASHPGWADGRSFRGRAGSRPSGPPAIQRATTPGKALLDDLTRSDWLPKHKTKDRAAGRKAISGWELNILVRGAAIAAWSTYAYHATKSRNVDSILVGGLDPDRGGTGAAAGNDTFEEHSRDRIHYTRNTGLAGDYQRHFEGDDKVFGRKDPDPGPAEVLQVVVPSKKLRYEDVDPDSKGPDQAYRNTRAIGWKNISRTAPAPLPAARPRKHKRFGRSRDVPLTPGDDAGAWQDHLTRAGAEKKALFSNMPDDAIEVLAGLQDRGLDLKVVMHTVIQALRSLATNDILEMTYTKKDLRNPRVRTLNLDPTGNFLPFRG
jgi:hypothetical protein